MNEPIQIPEEEWMLIESWLLQGDADEEVRKRQTIDPMWSRKVETVREFILGVEEAEMREKLKGFHKGLDSNSPAKSAKVFQFRPWMAIAASLILIIGIAFWMYIKSDPYAEIYANNYHPDPGLITAMGPAEDYDFQIGMVDYKNEQYEKAIGSWNQLIADRPDNDTLQYFLGAAYHATNNLTKAKEYYQQVLGNSASTFAAEAEWYLALIFLKEGDKEAAIKMLAQSSLPKAKALLKQIKS